jgi:hypothetical protein
MQNAIAISLLNPGFLLSATCCQQTQRKQENQFYQAIALKNHINITAIKPLPEEDSL